MWSLIFLFGLQIAGHEHKFFIHLAWEQREHTLPKHSFILVKVYADYLNWDLQHFARLMFFLSGYHFDGREIQFSITVADNIFPHCSWHNVSLSITNCDSIFHHYSNYIDVIFSTLVGSTFHFEPLCYLNRLHFPPKLMTIDSIFYHFGR